MDSLLEFTYGLVNFLAVSETKLDTSFPTGQFNVPGFRTTHGKDVSGKSGRLLLYVNTSIPPKVLKVPDCLGDIQVITVEIKTTFTKMPPNKLQYRNYNQFEAHSFLEGVGQLPEKISYTKWEKDFVKTLNTLLSKRK